MRAPKSLSSRLLLIISLWLLVALVATALLLANDFRRNAEQNFQNLLQAHVYNVMGAIEVSNDGELSGQPDLGDPRFLTPLSGWYWAVSAAANPQTPLLSSRSIAGREKLVSFSAAPNFTEEFRRSYSMPDVQGVVVQRLDAQLFLGDGSQLYQVSVAGSRGELEEAIRQFNNRLYGFLGLLGAGTLIALLLSVRLGLRPLDHAIQSLVDVREGRSEKLEGKFPTEVEPLAVEINALIEANKSVTERARTQVGNLAHALKTPLAVITNETDLKEKGSSSLIAEQATLMKSQISTYLDRARIAAQRRVIGSKTDALAVSNKLVRVMKRLSPTIDFVVDAKGSDAFVFQGEEQDLEEILGNLLENASRFAQKQVAVNLSKSTSISRSHLVISIEDDGDGLTAEQMKRAVKRGERLDESEPGSGLGLSIVRDIADEYGGEIQLEKSELGGLKVAVFLPSLSAR